MLACQCIPEGNNVEAIHCGKNVAMLLPEQIIVSLSPCVLQLQLARKWKFKDFLHDTRGMDKPDSLLADVEDCLTVLREIDELVDSQASLVEQPDIQLNQVVTLVQSENDALVHHAFVRLRNPQISEIIVEFELHFVVEKYE